MTKPFLKNLTGRNGEIKKRIIGLFINDDSYTISELGKEMDMSVPTVTKHVSDLIEDGYLMDLGKCDNGGGRKPSRYGLNPDAGFLVGVDVNGHHLSVAVTDFKGSIVNYSEDLAFATESNESSLRNLCSFLKQYLRDSNVDVEKILAYGFNLTGRVNSEAGYSFSYFLGEDRPLTNVLEEEMDAPVLIENDSRAMAYGEYIDGVGKNEKDMIFLNLSWGLGMGMIIDGKLNYGKSGFSGEIGHVPMLDNNRICRCGKVGCIETGASGSAAHRIFLEKLSEGQPSVLSEKYRAGEEITLADILDALNDEDVLAIETIEEIGSVLGKAIAGLINIFNPELIVIGGSMSSAMKYLQYPIKAAINKHSLNLVVRDTTVKFSKLGRKAGPVGACLLSRSKLLGLV